ncbi:unnamed protein product [Bemisia tabaci]|uniref:Uncharacterized protein n=1 Tax=Bemisia tabaci TaxID=7038 RepID=A0AAI8Y5Z6_BEMTA|nr:PREDICTED: uncharacterized protein LOC109032221 [Bemisia tabaci]CAH0747841.1 unnamed protein product [Bemisia tabaci]
MQWPPLLLSCVVIVTTSMIEAYSLQRKNVWSPSRAAVWLSPLLQSEPELAHQYTNNEIESDTGSDPESVVMEQIAKRAFTTISRWQPSQKEEQRMRTRSLVSLIPSFNILASIQRKTRQGAQEKYRRPIGLPLRWG